MPRNLAFVSDNGSGLWFGEGHMPIVWGVNHAARLVSAKATGELGRTDIEDYLDGLVAAATLSYRKVLDMAECRLALSGEDMSAIGARIRGHEARGPMGSVAVIAGSDELYDQIRQFESVVDAASAAEDLSRCRNGLRLVERRAARWCRAQRNAARGGAADGLERCLTGPSVDRV